MHDTGYLHDHTQISWPAWARVRARMDGVRTAAAESDGARRGGARASAFPNVTLYTHEGKAVKFYDDLIHGKVVAINMMYAECEGICPIATSNLVRVQELWAIAWGVTSSCTRSRCSPSWTRRSA